MQLAQDEVGDQIPLIVGISTSTKTVNNRAESCIRGRLSGDRGVAQRVILGSVDNLGIIIIGTYH